MSNEWRLLNAAGEEVKVGDTVTSFRGNEAKILSVHPPHREGTSGRVSTTAGFSYVGVYGLRFERAQ